MDRYNHQINRDKVERVHMERKGQGKGKKDWKLKPGFHEMNPDSSGSTFPTCWGQQSESNGGEQLTQHRAATPQCHQQATGVE